MIVVFDTCVLFGDWFLKSSSFRVISRYGKVIFPSIVVDELKNKYREELRKSYTNFEKYFNEIIALQGKGFGSFMPVDKELFNATKNVDCGGIDCSDCKPKFVSAKLSDNLPVANSFLRLNCLKGEDALFEDYCKFLNRQVLDEVFFIADYPTVPHQSIVHRALSGKKPFSSDGRKGYRDYLIWLTVLDIARSNSDEEIHFITSNFEDFAKGKQESDRSILHSDLLTDIGNCNIVYWASIKDFFDSKLKPILDSNEAFSKSEEKQSLIEKIQSNDELIEAIKDLVTQKASELDYYSNEISEVILFNDLDNEYEIDISVISDTEYLMDITFETICTINMYIPKSELATMTKKELRHICVINPDYNNHVALANYEEDVDITAQLIFKKDCNQIEGFELTKIVASEGGCPYCPDYDDDDDEEGFTQ